ncbi:MAG: glycosyltransferase family 39 protein [Pseudomonadota bacterium]
MSAQRAGFLLAVFVLIYAAAHSTLRLSFSGNFTTDDAQAVLAIDALRLGYTVSQPPLYEWLLYSAHHVFGVSLAATLFVKYTLLGLTTFFLFQTALCVVGKPAQALFSVLSLALYYQISWNLLEGNTHSLTVIFATALSVFAATRIMRNGDLGSYLLLTIALGLGLLSKFSYLFIAVALLISLYVAKETRVRLNTPLLVGAVLLGLLLASPYALWLIAQDGFLSGLTDKTRTAQTGLAAFLGLDGPLKAVVSAFLYSLPFLPFFALCFFSAFRNGTVSEIDADRGVYLRFLRRFFVLSIGLVVVTAVLSDASNIKERHFHPFFLVLPIIVFAHLDLRPVSSRALTAYATCILVIVSSFFLVRFASLAIPEDWVCGRCRESIPFDRLARAVEKNDAPAILAYDPYTGSNLLRFFPRGAVFTRGSDAPLSTFPDGCRALWRVYEESTRSRSVTVLEKVFPNLQLRKKRRAPPPVPWDVHRQGSEHLIVPWEDDPAASRISEWRIKTITDPTLCRTLRET